MNKIALASIASLLMASTASAATLSYSASLAEQSTNYNNVVVSVSQFDASLGTLNSVFVALTGSVSGDAKAESLDASATSVLLNLTAQVSASTSALGSIAVTLPTANETFAASAFDGTIDFGGTSGISYLGLTATDDDSATLIGSSMNEFIGLGTVDLLIGGLGQSSASGSGNLITQFMTRAGAGITVTYDYTAAVQVAPIPLPAALPMLGLALAGIAAFGRRARA